MRILIDNNLSFTLTKQLQAHFPGSIHLTDEHGIHADDINIWNYAKSNNFSILTKDNDFDEISQLKGCPPKVIHLICGNKTTQFIIDLILKRNEEIKYFIASDSENCILKIN
ncbi:MAG: DUF5615 family PIN-like protein [Saprospiraceae bacterium]